ncbi:MAG: tetratricopeptide repeat protein [Intestinimonas sp.]
MCELGLCYEMGAGLEEDKAQAVRWYTRAAELGYAPGQCNLGYCYLTGIGVEEDDVQAVRWLTQAAEQDFSRAQRLLGCCCRDGDGTPADAQKRWSGSGRRPHRTIPRPV